MLVPTLDAYKLFHMGALALAKVEANGIRIDTAYLDQAIADTDAKISQLQKVLRQGQVYDVWRREYGDRLDLGSRTQLGKIIFDKLKYPSVGKTATGRYRTDESAFERVDLPFVKDLLKVEKLKKARGTYLEGIRRETVDGFLHPFINLHTVNTYRSSSDSPNLQNQPIRNPEISEIIRRCFIPREGHALIEADFSALEFSIAADFWKDPRMIAYAGDPKKDIHRDMAAKIFLCNKTAVSKQSRYVAKNQFVFPELYGSFYVKQAQAIWEAIDEHQLTVGAAPMKDWLVSRGILERGPCDPSQRPLPGTFEAHMKKVEDYFNQTMFPVFAASKAKWWEAYQKSGEFQLMTGFVIRGVHSRNFLLNSPIQGPGFHLLLLALILLQRYLHRNGLKCLDIGEIHDCLLLDCPLGELQQVLSAVKRIMTKDVPRLWKWVIVPPRIEIDVATDNWFGKKSWQEVDGKWGPAKK